jgi:hypothetical protein
VYTPIYRDFNVTVAIDHGGFSIPPPSQHGGDGLLSSGSGINHGGEEWLSSPTSRTYKELLIQQLLFTQGRHPYITAPSGVFPAKFTFLNYMNWKIDSPCYCAYTIYFWALVQSNYHIRSCLICFNEYF